MSDRTGLPMFPHAHVLQPSILSMPHTPPLQVVCHGIPDKRPLVNGDIVNVDVSVFLDGYHADLNETYVVGEVDSDSKHLIKATYDVRRPQH